MANKRTLKKRINKICEGLFTEGVAVSLYGPESARANAEAVLYTIVKVEDHFIRRISHVEPGMTPKVYFKDLREKFNEQVAEILDQING